MKLRMCLYEKVTSDNTCLALRLMLIFAAFVTIKVFIMKVFSILMILSIFSLTSMTSDVAAAEDIRQYSAIGTKNFGRRALDRPKKGWFNIEWNKSMGKIIDGSQSCAFEDHYPAIKTKIYWSDAYVDDRIKPSRNQARDPNWSNYVWNKKETGSDYVFDGISDALNSEQVDNGEGIAKLSVLIGLTATSGSSIPPQWMREDKSLTWLEGKNSNSNSRNWHVRFDNPTAVDHAGDFLTAFLAKYGDNKGIHSVNVAEYYTGQKQYRPGDLNRAQYWRGMKNLWELAIKAAPRDENGQRVNIVQTNPVFSSDVTVKDMELIGIGISESDTRLEFADEGNLSANMRKLHDGGKVHVMINGDARFACQARRQAWDGSPNPFGYKKGYAGVATPQEIFWFHSEKAPAPVHSFFMTIARQCSGPQSIGNFIDAIKKFGRCGTEASRWGVAPAAFSGKAAPVSVARIKPNAPIMAVN